jgi:uncharacterized membrane protein
VTADEIRSLLAPHYLSLKALHVLAAMVWGWSTAVAWIYYLKPAFRRALAHPEDPDLQRRRDQMMEAFDRGVVLEHVAFPILLASGLGMLWLGGFGIWAWSWLSAKLLIVSLVFVPIEIADYHLAHFGGNKARARRGGNLARYRSLMRQHWIFFRVTEPVIALLVPLVVYLAVAKPF